MFYRCKSCGGNVIYDPKKKAMVCESCRKRRRTGSDFTGEEACL